MGYHAKYFLTVTGGRTGSAWLADFLGTNLGIKAIHEPLGIDDFGVNMPDIKIMRSFNERGNNAFVREFWTQKLDRIGSEPCYAETNHTLAKCGLIENLVNHPIAKDTTLIVLRRDRIKQCVSYVTRHTFANITMAWQWFLHPTYKNIIVDPRPFLKFKEIGQAMWFVYEMDARQRYYVRQYGDRLNFVEADLESITTDAGAVEFAKALGLEGTWVLPPPANVNARKTEAAVTDMVTRLMKQITYDPDLIVEGYIRAGRRLSGN